MTPQNLYFRGFGVAVNHHRVAASSNCFLPHHNLLAVGLLCGLRDLHSRLLALAGLHLFLCRMSTAEDSISVLRWITDAGRINVLLKVEVKVVDGVQSHSCDKLQLLSSPEHGAVRRLHVTINGNTSLQDEEVWPSLDRTGKRPLQQCVM